MITYTCPKKFLEELSEEIYTLRKLGATFEEISFIMNLREQESKLDSS